MSIRVDKDEILSTVENNTKCNVHLSKVWTRFFLSWTINSTVAMQNHSHGGFYTTGAAGADLSDHPAVWATMELSSTQSRSASLVFGSCCNRIWTHPDG